MATRLFVGNIPDNADEDELRSAFSAFGEITKLELKTKPGEDTGKKFAFISISGDNFHIESCIKHFTREEFSGSRLYVTRARESFLERLEREREQAKQKELEKEKSPEKPKTNPVIKLSEKLNPRKRKTSFNDNDNITTPTNFTIPNNNRNNKIQNIQNGEINEPQWKKNKEINNSAPEIEKHSKIELDPKKQDSEKKRMESLKRKRQEFKEKQQIIKSGLTAIDKVQNKKIRFDNEEEQVVNNTESKQNKLFDDDASDSGDEVNFQIKEQFEGKKGQKVLDLQSRYKSDKRFMLDERFIDNEQSDIDNDQYNDAIEVQQTDEKEKQLDILQNVLGVTLKRKLPDDDSNKKNKPKLGMLRFDPTHPEHAKFLAPVEETKQETKKSKKKKKELQQEEKNEEVNKLEEQRPEVSKEQFYKVSETLKEAIVQPTSFSLRSLFGNRDEEDESKNKEEDASYIPLEPAKKSKVKNPLEPNEKNPFVYDSSDSEDEVVDTKVEPTVEPKAVWKENLFFGIDDQRLKDGLSFFNAPETEPQKERRELKSVMKKRIYNKERKNQMFQKKIGGRKKTMKKSFRKKS